MEVSPTRKQLVLGGGHLLAVWTLAFVQPLLDLLGKNPDFFVARGNSPGDILILAFGFTLIPPLVLFLVEWVASRINARLYNWLHLVFLGGITMFFFSQLISKVITTPTFLIVLLAVGFAALFAWAVHRSGFLRNLLDILIIAPVVIVALFVFQSPTSDVIFPGSAKADATASTGDDRPIVLVIFDELGTSDLMTSRDRIDAGRYPNFAKLAKQSTWYKNQSTTDFFTPRAVPAILTGRIPPDEALPTAARQPNNLFTLLGRDRPLHVMEPVTALCPKDLCVDTLKPGQAERLLSLWSDLKYVEGRLVLPPGLADRLPVVSDTFEGFAAVDTTDRADRTDRFFVKEFGAGPATADYEGFIDGIPESRRGLTFLHALLPHQPWRFTPDGRTYNESPIDRLYEPEPDRWSVDPDGIATVQERMYTQTGLADRLIGKLMRTLKRRKLWDDAIVVVAADHGISFEGGDIARRRVDERAMGEVANPPLFIKYPNQKNGRTEEAHSTVLDILPTVLRATGASPERNFEGVPLQGPIPDRPVTVKDVKQGDRDVSVGLIDLVRQRDAAIERADRRLGRGPLFTLGPASELIGRKAPPAPAGSAEAILDDPGLWENVDPSREPLPLFVTGTLESGHGPGTTIAVAVNGRIRGTARAFAFEDVTRFGTLIDPSALKPGRNEIGIHAVEHGKLIPLAAG